MATRISGSPSAPAPTNGARPRQAPAGAGPSGARRSAPMALAGVVAVALGALLFLALYTSIDRRQSVLGVARPVAAGQVITAADLRDVRISSAAGVRPLAASQRASVVGKTAAVPLVPGSLLVDSQLGASSGLQPNQAVVGVALKPGQAPPGLRSGTRVQVVDSAKSSGIEQARAVVLTSSAIVSAVERAEDSSSGTTVVSLTVPVSDAPAISASAMDGRLSLVVLPGAP